MRVKIFLSPCSFWLPSLLGLGFSSLLWLSVASFRLSFVLLSRSWFLFSSLALRCVFSFIFVSLFLVRRFPANHHLHSIFSFLIRSFFPSFTVSFFAFMRKTEICSAVILLRLEFFSCCAFVTSLASPALHLRDFLN